MAFVTFLLLAASVVLALQGGSDALGEITCLSFEKNSQGSRGVWVEDRNVQRIGADCPSGKWCAQFKRRAKDSSALYIPRFAQTFSAWRSFTLSFWFKTGDDKTSLLFHNDLCNDQASLYVTIYNAGMLVTELRLNSHKTAMTVVFMSRNEWHHVAIVWTGRDINTYVDAMLKATSPLSGGRLYNSVCRLVVGGHSKNQDDGVVPYMGYMDQICMYRRGLSSSQVKYIYEHP